MRSTVGCLLIVFSAYGFANAQTRDDLQIRLGMYSLNPDGGERPGGIWFVTRPTIGKPMQSFWSFGETCEAWTVSSKPYAREDATSAWRIETTPIRAEGDAVTFRLRWVRVAALKQQLEQLSFDDAKATRSPNEDLELTLRPGQSYPVDSVRVPAGAKNEHGKPCGPSESIRVSVDVYPDADAERRLVVTDLWLVERLPDGSEAQRSQPLTIRGLPNRPSRFYFDSLVDGTSTLDIFGLLTASPESSTIAVSVDTRSRWAPEPRNFSGPQRFLKSQIEVKPAETVDVRLPLLGEEAGVFAKRALSIRIRARQIR
jgi:hypothetical protein